MSHLQCHSRMRRDRIDPYLIATVIVELYEQALSSCEAFIDSAHLEPAKFRSTESSNCEIDSTMDRPVSASMAYED